MEDLPQILASLPRRISDPLARWAAERPEAPVFRQGDRVVRFGETAALVEQIRTALIGWGIRPGDRVMLVHENSIEACLLLLALARLDAWAVMVNARLSGPEIDAIRDHCGARRLFYTDAVSPDAARHGVRHGAEAVTLASGDRLLIGPLNEQTAPEPVAESGADQVAALIYTSGTTGTPKGVMLTHRNLAFIGVVSGRQRGLVADDLVYGVLPLSHVFGLSSVFTGTLNAGACLLLVPRFTPQAVFEDVARGMTVLQGVPAMYAKMLEYVRLFPDTDVRGQLRYMSVGGSPLDPAIKSQTEALFGLPLQNGYGLTEASPTIAQTRIGEPRDDCSVGPVVPGVEIRIVGLDGQPVAPGAIGELWANGPGIMKGYYRNPEQTARVIDGDGWLNTGDMARQDPSDGALFIVGRSKELIIRSGFNVYPADVEAVLNAHPLVTQSAVVGRTTPDGNEDVIAFVQVPPGCPLTVAELAAFVAGKLTAYKRPGAYVLMDTLPAGATGKILKHRLAEQAKSLPLIHA